MRLGDSTRVTDAAHSMGSGTTPLAVTRAAEPPSGLYTGVVDRAIDDIMALLGRVRKSRRK
jgi:hypothetical protein